MAIPQDEHFPTANKSELGLHPVELENFYGLLFVRILPGGHSVAEQFGTFVSIDHVVTFLRSSRN